MSSTLAPAVGPNRTAAMVTGLAVLLALALAAVAPMARPVVLLATVAAFILAPAGSPLRWGAAAAMPVAAMLTWGVTVDVWMTDGELLCSDPASGLAVSRVAEAALVIVLVGLLAWQLGSRPEDLGIRRPTRAQVVLAVVAIAVIPLFGMVAGPILAEPFFGPIHLEVTAIALVPALALAIANGTMEELAYRGALLRWDARLTGFAVALVGQALVFGLAHLGDDFISSPLPAMFVIGLGGLLAGVVARVTGSLFLPIVVHICFDVPIYFALACNGA